MKLKKHRNFVVIALFLTTVIYWQQHENGLKYGFLEGIIDLQMKINENYVINSL